VSEVDKIMNAAALAADKLVHEREVAMAVLLVGEDYINEELAKAPRDRDEAWIEDARESLRLARLFANTRRDVIDGRSIQSVRQTLFDALGATP
jgi:hypothetical protein